ncbi:HAD family hydrolase [Plantactinospora sp. B5E13]|uniref:HAD family hydrolase n=1 Tax=unclassified Plantactinospora TaxID=2631981 RepID=UPI00325E7C18
MRSRPDPILILWDIDQTLVNIGSASRKLYEVAFRKATGHTLQVLADMAGRTERAIVTDTLALHGLSAHDEMLEVFYSRLAEAAQELRPTIIQEGRAMPGAEVALTAFTVEGFIQTVVTGNIRRIAEIKLESFGLDSYIDFEVGGYGSDGIDRATLVRLARQRSAAFYGQDFSANRTFVIGDTPHDIRGARDVGVRSVGVASGNSSIEALHKADADVVLPDLRNVAELRAAIVGDHG